MSRFADLPLLDAHVHLGSHCAIAQLLELSAEAGAKRLAIVCVPGTPERALGANAASLIDPTSMIPAVDIVIPIISIGVYAALFGVLLVLRFGREDIV